MGSSSSVSSRSLPNCERVTNEDEFENQSRSIEGKLKKEANSTKIWDKSLRFHDVCGRNIRFNSNKRIALRDEKSYCHGIVFSSRPLDIYERVYIRIIRLSSLWNGLIRFGFTSNDPNLMRKRTKSNCKYSKNDENNNNNNQNQSHQSPSSNSFEFDYDLQYESSEDTYPYDLPKYVYPNLTNKKGYWASAMDENRVKENDVVYFYVNANGEIHYGINGKYEGIFLSGVDVCATRTKQTQPLWAMFDIYGSTLAIEMIDLKSNEECEAGKSADKRSGARNDLLPVEHQAPSENSFEGLLLESRLRQLQSSTSNRANYDLNELNASNAYRPTVHTSSLGSTFSNGTSSSLNSNVSSRSSSHNNNNNNEHDSLDRLLISYRRLCIDNHYNETLHNSICDLPPSQPLNMLNERINAFYKSIPILIHDSMPCANSNRFVSRVHGRNVNISPDCLIAYRESSLNKFADTFHQQHASNSITHHAITSTHEPTHNAYVFLDKPVEKGKYFCAQIVGIDQNANESKMSLSIGCTTCKPHLLNAARDLPDDADCLLDRAEYWIVYKNLFSRHQVSLADELCFRLDEHTGNLAFFINGILVTQCLFNVDVTQTLWFFFDLCGKTNAIRLIPSCQLTTSPNSSFMQPQSQSTLKSIPTTSLPSAAPCASPVMACDTSTVRIKKKRPDSALIEYFKSQLLASHISADHSSLSNYKNQTSSHANQSTSCSSSSSATTKTTSTTTTTLNKTESKAYNQEECRICWDAPIECVFYSCGHMCLCWKCALLLKNNPSKCVSFASTTTSTSDLLINQTATSSSTLISDTMEQTRMEKKTTKPLCPICRNEIIDIIRFFKT